MPEELSAAHARAGASERVSYPLRAYLGAAAATVLWASNSVAVKLVLREIPPFATTALRVTLTAAVLASIHFASGGRFRLRPGEAANVLKLGLFGIAGGFFCLTTALNNTSVSHAVFLNSTAAIMVLLIARFHGLERITRPKVAGLLLSLAGVMALVAEQSGGRGPGWKGDLLALGCAACFAWFTVEGKKVAAAHSSLEFITFTFVAAALWLSPLLLVELGRVTWSAVGWASWLSLLYSVVPGSAIAYLAYYSSLRRLPPSRVAAFQYLQPVLTTVFAIPFFHDALTVQFGAGAALILLGLWLAKQRWDGIQ